MARERVFGLPIGRQKPRHQVAKVAGTAVAIVAPAIAVPIVRRGAPAARKVIGATRSSGDVVRKGQDMADKATDMMDMASNIRESVSSHSTKIGKMGGLVSAVAKGGQGKSDENKPKLSHLIEQHADIAAPRSVVYNQWTQFEMFPTLTKGIESVSQEEPDKVAWTAKIGPSRREWTGKIVEQVPDERIAWKSEGGASIQGVVTFHSLDEDLTRVLVQMEYKPTGAVEWVGNTLRVQRRRAKRDLRLFKHFIEMRGAETGAWRGGFDAEEPLQPQFSGQGQVGGGRRGGSQPRRSGSDNRATQTNGRRGNGGRTRAAQSNGRLASGERPAPSGRSRSRDGGRGNGSRPAQRG